MVNVTIIHLVERVQTNLLFGMLGICTLLTHKVHKLHLIVLGYGGLPIDFPHFYKSYTLYIYIYIYIYMYVCIYVYIYYCITFRRILSLSHRLSPKWELAW